MDVQLRDVDVLATHGVRSLKPDACERNCSDVGCSTVPPAGSAPLTTTTHGRDSSYDANAATNMLPTGHNEVQLCSGRPGNAVGSPTSSPKQHSGLLEQGINGNVAAAAAMHYKQQQSMLADKAVGSPVASSVATLAGLHDPRASDAQRCITSSQPAGTFVVSYLSSPKGNTASLNSTVARLPAALPGVSSLYGRLRTSALGGAAASASTGAAAAAAASACVNRSHAAAGSSVSSNHCQVVSQPQLWASGSAPPLAGGVASSSSADYLSLLMAATSLSPATAVSSDGTTHDEQKIHLMHQLQQLQATQAGGVGHSASLAGLPVDPAVGLSANGLLMQQLPAQQQQLLMASLSGNSTTTASQDQLRLMTQVNSGTLNHSPAGLQMAGLQQFAQGAATDTMFKSTGVMPGLMLNGGASDVTGLAAYGKMDMSLPPFGGSSGGPSVKNDGSHNPLYKTELCHTWRQTGSCRYGARCQFAHGQLELRAVVRPPKYKTQPCRTFSLTGRCPYGARCNFIHDGEDDEAVISRNRTESAAAAVANVAGSGFGRVSCNGGPASVSSATSALFGCGAVSADTSAAVRAGSAAAGLFNGVDTAGLGALARWNGVLPAESSYNSSLSAVALGANSAVNGMGRAGSMPGAAALNNICGLGLNGIGLGTADATAGVSFASGNGVAGLGQLSAGMLAGNVENTACLGQYGLLQNLANTQLGMSGVAGAGYIGDNFSQLM